MNFGIDGLRTAQVNKLCEEMRSRGYPETRDGLAELTPREIFLTPNVGRKTYEAVMDSFGILKGMEHPHPPGGNLPIWRLVRNREDEGE